MLCTMKVGRAEAVGRQPKALQPPAFDLVDPEPVPEEAVDGERYPIVGYAVVLPEKPDEHLDEIGARTHRLTELTETPTRRAISFTARPSSRRSRRA
jgi:hypothetical protein